MIATGVNDEGYREILGVMLGDGESEACWRTFFAWLKDRGLSPHLSVITPMLKPAPFVRQFPEFHPQRKYTVR
jgi:transposase-like protein